MVETLPQLLEHLAGHGDAEFLRTREKSVRAAEFVAAARRLAAELRHHGLQAGDRLLVFLDRSFEEALAPFAAALCGALVVLASPRLKDRQLRHLIDDCGPRLVLTRPRKMLALQDAAATFAGCSLLSTALRGSGETMEEGLDARSVDPDRNPLAPEESARPQPDEPAALLYTSGSTGPAKAVIQSHRNLVVGAATVSDELGLVPGDRILSVLPLGFDYGLNQLLGAAWVGCSLRLGDYLSGAGLRADCERDRATVLPALPSIWRAFAQALEAEGTAGLESLRTLTNTGGRWDREVILALRRLLPQARLFSMYGLTEAFRSAILPPEEIDRRPESCGQAVPGVELSLRNPATGERVAAGEVGELVHAGAFVGLGYWRRPEDSARVFRPHPDADREDPVVWSGDWMRQDENGFLEFVERRDQQIKIQGQRISPDEVRAVLLEEEGVADAQVLARPSSSGGEDELLAVLVCPDAASAQAAQVDLAERVRRDLPSHMQPRRLAVCPAIPLLANGKPDRRAMLAMFGGGGDGG